jgi:hypothetical protein
MATANAINNLATVLTLGFVAVGLCTLAVAKYLSRIATALEKRNSHADRQDIRDRFPGAPR